MSDKVYEHWCVNCHAIQTSKTCSGGYNICNGCGHSTRWVINRAEIDLIRKDDAARAEKAERRLDEALPRINELAELNHKLVEAMAELQGNFIDLKSEESKAFWEKQDTQLELIRSVRKLVTELAQVEKERDDIQRMLKEVIGTIECGCCGPCKKRVKEVLGPPKKHRRTKELPHSRYYMENEEPKPCRHCGEPTKYMSAYLERIWPQCTECDRNQEIFLNYKGQPGDEEEDGVE